MPTSPAGTEGIDCATCTKKGPQCRTEPACWRGEPSGYVVAYPSQVVRFKLSDNQFCFSIPDSIAILCTVIISRQVCKK